MADVYNVYRVCRFCGGSGEEQGPATCHKCGGLGRLSFGQAREREPQPDIETFDIHKTCGYCGGSGSIEDGTCPLCSGAGEYVCALQEKRE